MANLAVPEQLVLSPQHELPPARAARAAALVRVVRPRERAILDSDGEAALAARALKVGAGLEEGRRVREVAAAGNEGEGFVVGVLGIVS